MIGWLDIKDKNSTRNKFAKIRDIMSAFGTSYPENANDAREVRSTQNAANLITPTCQKSVFDL